MKIASLFVLDDQGRTIVYPFGRFGGGYHVPDTDTTKKVFLQLAMWPLTVGLLMSLCFWAIYENLHLFRIFERFSSEVLGFYLFWSGFVIGSIISRYFTIHGLTKVIGRPTAVSIRQRLSLKCLQNERSSSIVVLMLMGICIVSIPFMKFSWSCKHLLMEFTFLLVGIVAIYEMWVTDKAIKIKKQRNETKPDPFVLQLLEETGEVRKQVQTFEVLVFSIFVLGVLIVLLGFSII